MWLISLLLVFQLPCSSWAFLGRTESRQGLDAFYQRMHEDLLNLSEKLLLTDRTSPTLQGRSDSEVDAVNSSAPLIPVSVDGLTFQTRLGSQGKLLASCGQNVAQHPKKVECPAACPFMRLEPTRICEFKCVIAEKCGADNPLTSFANHETHRCSVCKVPACRMCARSSQTCAICHENYVLMGDQCLSAYRHYWRAFYVFFAALVLLIIVYIVTLALRPTTNRKVLEHGLTFRRLSKVKNHENRPYPLNKNLRKDYIAGIGIMLHFNWQYYMIIYALGLMLVMVALALCFSKRPALQKISLQDDDSLDVCNKGVTKQKEELTNMEVSYLIAVIIIYIFSFVASIIFAVCQRRFGNRTSLRLKTMQDYVIQVFGLPRISGTHPLEDDLKTLFSKRFQECGAKVIGVSVCWDYTKLQDEVTEQIRREIDERADDWTIQFSQKLCGARSTRVMDEPPKGLRHLDAIFGITHEEDEKDEEQLKSPRPVDEELPSTNLEKEDIVSLLKFMKCSGSAFIVFESETQRDKALEFAGRHPLSFKGTRLRLSSTDAEPQTVFYENFGVSDEQVYLNIVVGTFVMILAIALLDVLFYFPSVAYFMSVSDVVGMTQGGFQGTLLGLLVCACNQIIYIIIGQIADRCGFKTSGNHQRFYVVSYTIAVFINTVIDLFVVMLLAQGYSMDQAMEAQTGEDKALSPKAIAENPTMQRSIYVQYAAYVFPSCLLTPFLLEPVALGGLYLLQLWLVRSRREVSFQDAEKRLQGAPFDLARYGDIIINVMLVVALLGFTYRDLWQIFACLVVSLLWIYGWDTYRFLRLSMATNFVTMTMDQTAHKLFAFPCAILAGCVAFRLYGLKHNVQVDVLGTWAPTLNGMTMMPTVDRKSIVIWICMACTVHLIIHLWILQIYVPRWGEVTLDEDEPVKEKEAEKKEEKDTEEKEGKTRSCDRACCVTEDCCFSSSKSAPSASTAGPREDVPYSKIAETFPCNWFNSNPVFCLRSKYIYDHKIPCIPYGAGLEHLLLANPEIGLYYEHSVKPDLDVAPSIQDDFRSLFAVSTLMTKAEAEQAQREMVGTMVRTSMTGMEFTGDNRPSLGEGASK